MGKEKTLHIYISALNAFVRALSLCCIETKTHTHTERRVVRVRSERRRRHARTQRIKREREREILSLWESAKKSNPKREKGRHIMSAAATFRRSSKHVTKHVKEASKHLIKKWKIFTGDRVVVTAGKDKGQIGQVTKVLRKENTLIVSGINLVKKHVKPQPQPGEPSPPGQIISVEQPIHYSNVSLVDPNTGGRVRIQSRFLDDGTKVRVTKGRLSSQTIVPKPDQLLERKTARGTGVGEKDTREDAVREVTYVGPR